MWKWLLILGGVGGAAAYFLMKRKKEVVPVKEELPPEGPPPEYNSNYCNGVPLPREERGFKWICRSGVWKKKRTEREAPKPVTMTLVL